MAAITTTPATQNIWLGPGDRAYDVLWHHLHDAVMDAALEALDMIVPHHDLELLVDRWAGRLFDFCADHVHQDGRDDIIIRTADIDRAAQHVAASWRQQCRR